MADFSFRPPKFSANFSQIFANFLAKIGWKILEALMKNLPTLLSGLFSPATAAKEQKELWNNIIPVKVIRVLGQPLSQKKVLENLGPEPPLNQWGRYFKRAWDRKHSYNMLKVKICNEIDTEESCVTSCRCWIRVTLGWK